MGLATALRRRPPTKRFLASHLRWRATLTPEPCPSRRPRSPLARPDGAVVERLLKVLREARPATAQQFFALVNQHMRWELNDLARRLDERPTLVELDEKRTAAPSSSGSMLKPNGR